MEALLIIFAELLFACLAPLFTLIGGFFLLLFEIIVLALNSIFGSKLRGVKSQRDQQETREKAASQPRKPIVSRKALHWFAGVSGGVAVVGLLASVLFFDPLLRTIMSAAEQKTGIAVTYAESSGSLLQGKVALNDVQVTRTSEEGLAFDLSIDRIEADVALFSLLSSEPRIQYAAVDGVTGFVTPPLPNENDAQVERERPKERRPFRADLAEVTNVDVEIRARTAEPYDLVIETGQVAPFRSRLALFDLLFRSNLTAEVAGQPLFVSTRELSEEGRETIWAFEEVEVDSLKLVLPRAPLTWLSDGTITARVQDRWDLSEDEIDMDWQFILDGIDVATPETAGRAERLLAGGLAKAVDRQGGSANFEYRLELGPEEVAALRAGDLSAFWDTVLSGFTPSFLARADGDAVTEEGEPGRVRGAIDALRERLRGDGGE